MANWIIDWQCFSSHLLRLDALAPLRAEMVKFNFSFSTAAILIAVLAGIAGKRNYPQPSRIVSSWYIFGDNILQGGSNILQPMRCDRQRMIVKPANGYIKDDVCKSSSTLSKTSHKQIFANWYGMPILFSHTHTHVISLHYLGKWRHIWFWWMLASNISIKIDVQLMHKMSSGILVMDLWMYACGPRCGSLIGWEVGPKLFWWLGVPYILVRSKKTQKTQKTHTHTYAV